MSIEETLVQRGKQYGVFAEHALVTQNIKRAMQGGKNWPTLRDNQKEALEMIAHKIGRILNGNPNYHDNFIDIQGYAKLVADTLVQDNQ